MTILQAIILGFVQGATEFIPVSSSGHLVLAPWLLGWPAPGLVFDTMVHWGTLAAIVAYFWRDWRAMISAWGRGLVRRDWSDPNARLAWLLAIGSIPAAALGFLLEDWFESLFGEPAWVSFFLVVTAAILLGSEWLSRSKRARRLADLRWPDALIIGVGQAAAIAPGISRSGATMSAGLLRGLDRPAAARFSFLLATPAIVGAGLLQLVKFSSTADPLAQLPLLAAGFLTALITGYAAIWGLLRYLQRHKLTVFAFYCLWVGTSCLVVAWLR